MVRMTKRAARRRRRRIAIVLIAIAALAAAWWGSGVGLPFATELTERSDPVAAVTSPSTVVQSPRPQVAPPAPAPIAVAARLPTPEEEWAEARRESIRIQQRLRKEAAADRARVNAQQNGDDVRCIDGHRMKRVQNGWVEAGAC